MGPCRWAVRLLSTHTASPNYGQVTAEGKPQHQGRACTSSFRYRRRRRTVHANLIRRGSRRGRYAPPIGATRPRLRRIGELAGLVHKADRPAVLLLEMRLSRRCTGSALTLTIPIALPSLEKSRRRQRTARYEGDRQGRDSGRRDVSPSASPSCVRSESAYRRRPFLHSAKACTTHDSGLAALGVRGPWRERFATGRAPRDRHPNRNCVERNQSAGSTLTRTGPG